jgi:hypothetical protein
MNLIWYTVLIRAIPEAIGIILLSLAIVKKKVDVKGLIICSLIYGLAAFTLRMLPIKYGINIFLTVILETLILSSILKVSVKDAFKGIVISLVILTFFEMTTITFYQYVLKLNLQVIYSSGLYTILSGLPSLIGLYIIAFIIFRINKKRS